MEENYGFASEDNGKNKTSLSRHSKNDHSKDGKIPRHPKNGHSKDDEIPSQSDYKKKLELMRERKKKKQEKKKRLIIRNLSFKIDEDELKEIFSKYGKVSDVIIPKKPDGKKRGFAFVQYAEFWSTIQAIKKLNYQEFHGRPIAIDYAVSKDQYEHINSSKVVSKPAAVVKAAEEESESDQSMQDEDAEERSEDTSSEAGPEEKKVNQFLKEFDEGRESEVKKDEVPENDPSDSSSDDEGSEIDGDEEKEDDDDDDGKQGKPSESKIFKSSSQKNLDDINEGKTVFVRNICFETEEDVFKQAMEEYGPVKYCLFCVDRLTDHPKGTAFVKFENKEDAEKLIAKSSDDNSEGIFIDGRRLYSSLAVSREDLQKKIEDNKKKGKDKRNLALLKEGQVRKNSYEAEGVSESDLAKRYKLEMLKKNKLKNLHFFVSDTRLCVHNIPPTFKDANLRQIFKNAVGPEANITEARIMRNLQKVGASGDAESKGFGFVAFSRHEDALQALRKINNDPKLFTAQKRPIVEFSIENKIALLSKQRSKEKSRMKSKKKSEQSEANQSIQEQPEIKIQANKNKGRNKPQHNNKQWQNQKGKNLPSGENTRKRKLGETEGRNQMNKQWQNRKGKNLPSGENTRKRKLGETEGHNQMNKQWQNQKGKILPSGENTRKRKFGETEEHNQNKKWKRFDGAEKRQSNMKHSPSLQKKPAVKEKKQKNKKKRKNGVASRDKMDGGHFSKLVNNYKEKLMNKME